LLEQAVLHPGAAVQETACLAAWAGKAATANASQASTVARPAINNRRMFPSDP